MGCESIQWHYVGFQRPARLLSGGRSIILSMLDRQSYRKTNCTGVSNANWSFDMNTSRTDSKGWSFTKRPTSGDVEIVSSPETVYALGNTLPSPMWLPERAYNRVASVHNPTDRQIRKTHYCKSPDLLYLL
jgi:hypothetical protein